jgi:NosR/NirI family transcriptional regulator, nitrous oxide reductase regulator
LVSKQVADSKDAAGSELNGEAFDAAWDEARDHLFPWGRHFARRRRGVQALSIAFAFLVTLAWILGILGRVRPEVVLGWWLAWSAFELVVRVKCQPGFRNGHALQRLNRPATARQIVAYVIGKNTMIGALLFLLMAMLGHPVL